MLKKNDDRIKWTLPLDEWNEMTKGQQKAARAMGIRPEPEFVSEDEQQDRRDRSSQYSGPSG